MRTVKLTEGGKQKIHDLTVRYSLGRLRRAWSIYVEHALHAQWLLKRDVDYVILDGRLAFVDENTGRIFADRSWSEGLHQAIEIKEGLAPTSEHDSDRADHPAALFRHLSDDQRHDRERPVPRHKNSGKSIVCRSLRSHCGALAGGNCFRPGIFPTPKINGRRSSPRLFESTASGRPP